MIPRLAWITFATPLVVIWSRGIEAATFSQFRRSEGDRRKSAATLLPSIDKMAGSLHRVASEEAPLVKARKNKHLKSRDNDPADIQAKASPRAKGIKKRANAAQDPKIKVFLLEQREKKREETRPPVRTVGTTRESVSTRQSVNTCQLNENGLYGTADALSDVYTVQYLYQTSVRAGTTMIELENSVIQNVDKAITTAILPSFFDCDNGVRRRRLQGGTVGAISSKPIDTFISSGCKYSRTRRNLRIVLACVLTLLPLLPFIVSIVCEGCGQLRLLCSSGASYSPGDRVS
jgi:hypothetical protein